MRIDSLEKLSIKHKMRYLIVSVTLAIVFASVFVFSALEKIEAYYNYLRDEYFPKNPSVAPEVADELNIANIDRWNRTNEIFKDNNADPINNTVANTSPKNIYNETVGATAQRQVLDSTKMEQQTLPFKDPPNLV